MSNRAKCSLQSWTVVASAYTLILSMLALTWTMLLVLTLKGAGNNDILTKLIVVSTIADVELVSTLSCVTMVFELLWLVSAILLLHGNWTFRISMIFPWLSMTFLITLWNVATSLYFIVILSKALKEEAEEEIYQQKSTTHITLVFLSSGGFVSCIANALFIRLVCQRGKEIYKIKNEISMSDMSGMAFHDQSNFEAEEDHEPIVHFKSGTQRLVLANDWVCPSNSDSNDLQPRISIAKDSQDIPLLEAIF